MGQGAGGGRPVSPRGRGRRRGRPSFAERAAESIGSAAQRSKGGEQRPPVDIDYKKEPMPQALRGSPSPPGPTTPSPRSASIRSRRTSRAGRPVGSDRARPPRLSPPPSLDLSRSPGSDQSKKPAPQDDPDQKKIALRISVGSAPADTPGGIEDGGAVKRSEAALLPQGRQHSRRGPASIRRRRTSRAAAEEEEEAARAPPRGDGQMRPISKLGRSESAPSPQAEGIRGQDAGPGGQVESAP